MNIKPLKKTVAAVRLKNKKETDSGIILTGAVAEVDKCKVVAVGDGVTMVGINDVLLIDWNKAQQSTIDGIPVYFVSEDDIVGVFDEE